RFGLSPRLQNSGHIGSTPAGSVATWCESSTGKGIAPRLSQPVALAKLHFARTHRVNQPGLVSSYISRPHWFEGHQVVGDPGKPGKELRKSPEIRGSLDVRWTSRRRI